MIIAGLEKQSLIEYPGKISAVIFLAGCNLRCCFCYVPYLVLPEKIRKIKPILERDIISFLKERKGFLEAVAISGGEPTTNKDLQFFIEKIKRIGYLVELETNGTNSEILKYLIDRELVDYVAMDIKHRLDFSKYNKICGGFLTKKLFREIKKSIEILISGGIDYEFRTTVVREFHKKEDILSICKEIKGAKVYYLQNFHRIETIFGEELTPFGEKEILDIVKEGRKLVPIKFREYL